MEIGNLPFPVLETIAFLAQPDCMLAILDGSQSLLESGNAAAARDWLEEALKKTSDSQGAELLQYMAIPTEIKLGLKERALQSAKGVGAKGYVAVAISCIEIRDLPCMHEALAKMQASPVPNGDERMSGFEKKLQSLNVAAALIDYDELNDAEVLLDGTERSLDDLSKTSIIPELQSERTVLLAKRENYAEARTQALGIRHGMDQERGDALRILASLETKANGLSATRDWALSLAAAEDRAYALVGILEATLGIGDVRLPYQAIQIH